MSDYQSKTYEAADLAFIERDGSFYVVTPEGTEVEQMQSVWQEMKDGAEAKTIGRFTFDVPA